MKAPAKLSVWACQQLFLGSCAAQQKQHLKPSEMAEIGLNVFQVIQNELISREGGRSSLGMGFRLSALEERMMNMEAVNRNGKIWKLNHHVSPVTALTPDARERVEKQKKLLLNRKGAKKMSDDKDPSMFTRKDERWEIHFSFPRTLLEFKELQYHPDRVRSLLEFYDIKVYRYDFKVVDIDPSDRFRDVSDNMETCLEELAMHWGINWQRIGGMSLPYPPTPTSSQFGGSQFGGTQFSNSQFTPAQTPSSSQFSAATGRFTPTQKQTPPPQHTSHVQHQ